MVPGLRRFSAQDLWRMWWFVETCRQDPILSSRVREFHGDAATGAFKDAYAVEFLNLPAERCHDDRHHPACPS